MEEHGLLKSLLYKFLGSGKKPMGMSDKVKTPRQGSLSIQVINHETGDSYMHINEHKNTITDVYRRNSVRLLGGDSQSGRIVTKMKFGDDGHDASSPSTPTITTADMLALNNTFLTKQITATTYEDDVTNNMTIVVFEVELTTAEGNGSGGTQIYSEAGLFTEDETPLVDSVSSLPNTGMVAVKHFGVLTKTSALSFKFQWRIIL